MGHCGLWFEHKHSRLETNGAAVAQRVEWSRILVELI